MHVRVTPRRSSEGSREAQEAETGAPAATPLKVGLLVDSYTQPQWVYDIVAEIQRSSYARVSRVVENGDVDQPERRFLRRLHRNRHRLAYALYTRLDDALFRREPDAFTNTSIESLLEGVARLRVAPIKKRL